MTGKNFNAKILLFGEYTLMVGSQALSIPYFHRFGHFIQSSGSASDNKSQEYLRQFIQFLKKQSEALPMLSVATFEKEVENGLAFETNIPIGYGLGSSGALVAAVYDRYATKKSEDLNVLKRTFSEMEAFFHGKSSGLDPLVCYLQKPIWVKGTDNVVPTPENHSSQQGNNALFLIDSQQMGETQPLVDYFTRQYKHKSYLRRIQSEMIPANNACIASWLNNDTKNFFPAIKSLSQVSQKLFEPMIPKKFKKVWEQGISQDLFYLKLCGSGGGGMILGFTRNFETVQKELGQFPLYLIQKF